MPHFCKCGADTYICQKCGKVFCSKDYPPEWRADITENKSAGNVCPECVTDFENFKQGFITARISFKNGESISLYEYCRRESGLSDAVKIREYINRHYGND